MDTKRISILDSTLRDGAQGENISFSVNDKLGVVKALDAFGVDFIEAGNPASNPKDLEFFERVATSPLATARLAAFGSTRRRGREAAQDENLAALLAAGTDVVVIFGKGSLMHVTEILRVSPEENLAMISESVAFLKGHGKSVLYDAEHFFDGYRYDAAYALSTLEAAADAGAEVLCLCDTNGGTLPHEVYEVTKLVVARHPGVSVGMHAHNDSGCAVANSLMAVEAGATHVQGTLIGFGERAGNADLSAVLPALKLKMGREAGGTLPVLTETAARVAEIANVVMPGGKPYVGASAFSHKAGMHVDGVLKNPRSFEHVDPEAVGNKRRLLVSEVSGRTGVWERVRSFAPQIAKDSPGLSAVLDRLKQLEHEGYQFEAADASFELMAKRTLGMHEPHFSVVFYKTMGEFPAGEDLLPSTATIQIRVGSTTEIAAAKGKGPVHALDIALRKALAVFFPVLADMHLIDYKVRVLEQQATTAAKVRVLIESADAHSTWTTVGVSEDIIEASFNALVDSIEYRLSHAE
ncbi:MAG: citramalate synthase [Coriobacteriales bacterium]|jgi:2-isopropylmalate synthase|nr:citramalate synthase [Coriobacteriales bacterium]